MISPTAFTAANADTMAPELRVTVNVPMPPFIAPFMPRSFPTVAPVPAPMLPSATGLSVAAAAADSPISRVGCALDLPMERS